MNIISKISYKNLLLNKKRTIGILIGIILSVALTTSVSGMFLSLRKSLVLNTINDTGYYHIALLNKTKEDIIKLENNRDIKKIHEFNDIGYATFPSIDDTRPYLHLYSFKNSNSFQDLSLKLIEGSYPKNKQEIVISEELNLNSNKKYNIGDTLSINVGTRKTLDNYSLNNTNPYTKNSEKIDNSKKMNFKIVGIIKRNYSVEPHPDAGITIISNNIESNTKTLYISLNNPKNFEKDLSELLNIDKNNLYDEESSYILNSELLRWEAFKFSDSTITMLYSVIIIILIIIVGTSIFCIKNSFDMSLIEKKRMYGMLLSVGATKKQIKKSILKEGLILSTIAIPLGILFGILAVYILIIITNTLISNINLGNDLFTFHIGIIPILLSIILGLLTIYLSSIPAALKASSISPIESIKSNEDIKVKSLKTPKFISKTFKIGGALAYKNLKRSKKKYRTTVISLIVSICTFISLNAFIEYGFKVTNVYYDNLDYDIAISGDPKDISNNLTKIINMSSEHVILYNDKDRSYLEINDLTKVTDFAKEKVLKDSDCKYNEKTDVYECEDAKKSDLEIIAMDPKDLKEYAKKVGINYESILNGGILVDDYLEYSIDGSKDIKRIYNYKENDSIKGTFKGNNHEIIVKCVTNIRPRGMEQQYYGGGYIIVSKEYYQDFLPEIITIKNDEPEVLVSTLEKETKSLNIENVAANKKANNTMNLIFSIFLYGFITVITLIGVTNIFNTITSNIELRSKEFAIFKSIGMTKKEFNNMINLETLFYSLKALIYGITFGLIGSFLIYKSFSKGIDFGFIIPYNAIIISIISVTLLIFIIMKYSISKINKQNIIETIRKENI